jgi:hypothetical protein
MKRDGDAEDKIETTVDAGETDYRAPKYERQQCIQRDRRTCVITKGGDCLQTARIFPDSLSNTIGQEEQCDLWEMLSVFWSAEQLTRWKSVLAGLGPDATQASENLFTVDPTVRCLWNKSRFALKPLQLSEDRKQLTVEFHWLSP